MVLSRLKGALGKTPIPRRGISRASSLARERTLVSSEKILIMPSAEEREREEKRVEERERSERLGSSGPTAGRDTLALETLMDVERSLGRLETAVEGLERSTAQHAKDLNGLGKVAHTIVAFAKLGLALIAGGLLAEIIRHLLTTPGNPVKP